MNTQSIKRVRWFWPWQDAQEEAWLERMSQTGWHLESLGLPCVYLFGRGEPLRYAYRLDYMPAEKDKWPEYLQIFQDAGWEYIGEMSNWRYWRKQVAEGETAEIFTDPESKIRKYQRILAFVGFFLIILVVCSRPLFTAQVPDNWSAASVVSVIYLVGRILYALLIPLYIFVVVKLLRRINQLKKKAI